MAALPIILNILKIIGIVLACVIGFVLLILLLVLFVPVRYKLRFVRTGAEGDDPVNAKGYVSWLLHIIHVSLGYPGEHYVIVRLFGIPIVKIPMDEEKKRKKAEKQSRKEKADSEELISAETTLAEEDVNAESEDMGTETVVAADSDDIVPAEDAGSEESVSEETISEESVSEESVSEEKKRSIFSRIRDFVHKIKCTINKVCDKIKKIADDLCDKTKSAEEKLNSISKDIEYYHRILTSELFERTFAKVKKRVFKLLRSILPQKGDIRMEVGFDDPYTTGEVLGIAAATYPITGRFLHVFGNFDESVIRGGGYIRGRIFIFMIVKLLLFYLFDRDLKKLIKLFKKETVNNKGHKVGGGRSNGRDQ